MTNKRIELFMLPILFVFLLIDGQISTLATNWLFGLFSITSHTVFMLAIFYASYVSFGYSLIIFSLLGLIYDLTYLGLLGIATTTFPLVIFCIYFFFQGMENKIGVNCLIFLVVLFQFEFISYLFARAFSMTNLSVFIFVFYKLLPSLLFNELFFLAIHPVLSRTFGIANKT